MIGYWRHNVVCLSLCLSIRLWRYALWLKDTSYRKSARTSALLGTRRYNFQPYTDPKPSDPPNFYVDNASYLLFS